MKFKRKKDHDGCNETRLSIGPFEVVFNRLLTKSKLHPRFGLYLGMRWRQ